MLHEKIKSEIADAMRAKDQLRLSVLRGLVTAFVNDLVAKGKKPQEVLPDEDVLAVIKRAVKQRKDAIEQFTAGGRPELAEKESEEMKILETYLPQTMSRDEIRLVALQKKEELGVTDKTKAGILTGAVMKELKGAADGSDVKAVVDSLF